MIRAFLPDDGAALRDLCRASIAELGSRFYSPEQVRVWRDRVPTAETYAARVANGAEIFISAAADNSPAAYALMEPDGHLDRLYCHPDHSGRGHAAALLSHVEGVAQAQGIPRLFTEASEVARPVFERAGYKVTHRRDFEVAGVPIHNYAMEKWLGRSGWPPENGQLAQMNSIFSTM